MAIAVHIVNTPHSDAGTAYEAGWKQLDDMGARPEIGEVLQVITPR